MRSGTSRIFGDLLAVDGWIAVPCMVCAPEPNHWGFAAAKGITDCTDIQYLERFRMALFACYTQQRGNWLQDSGPFSPSARCGRPSNILMFPLPEGRRPSLPRPCASRRRRRDSCLPIRVSAHRPQLRPSRSRRPRWRDMKEFERWEGGEKENRGARTTVSIVARSICRDYSGKDCS